MLDKDIDLVSFQIEDGFPLALNIDSFLVFRFHCVHKIENKIRIPVESACEWKLVNGIQDGAFKSHGGLNTQFSAVFQNSICAVYYPPRGGFDKSIKTKKIGIQLRIYPLILDTPGKDDLSVDEKNSAVGIKEIVVESEHEQNYFLEMSLTRMSGFRNRNSYSVKINCENLYNNVNDRSDISGDVCIEVLSEGEHRNHFKFLGNLLQDDDDDVNLTFNNWEKTCAICDLKLYLRYRQHISKERLKIDLAYDRFFTSEYVSLNYSLFSKADSFKISRDHQNNAVFVNIRNFDSSSLNLYLLGCPFPKLIDTVWTATTGSFPCGCFGNSVVFKTPPEKELRRSPITLSLSKMVPTRINYSKQETTCLDQRKIILLRRMIFGG